MHPPPRTGRTSISRQESQPRVISPVFSKPLSPLLEQDEEIWAIATQTPAPRTSGQLYVSMDACMAEFKRPVQTKSPDSGVDIGENVKGKGKEIEASPETTPRNSTTRTRGWSCPSKGSPSWLSKQERNRGPGTVSQSFDQPRPRSQGGEREVEEELSYGEQFEAILHQQDVLKDELTEGQVQKILNATGYGYNRLEMWDRFAGNPSQSNLRWTSNPVAAKMMGVRDLKFVTDVKWTPIKETKMTSAVTATVEDLDEMKRKDEKESRKKNKWWKLSKGPKCDNVSQCGLATVNPDLCRELRRKRRFGMVPGKIC